MTDFPVPNRLVNRWLGRSLNNYPDTFVFTFFGALAAVDLAKSWQANHAPSVLTAIGQHPLTALGTFGLATVWTFGYVRYFSIFRWPQWLAAPFVLLFLCPAAWGLAARVGSGAAFMELFIVQFSFLTAVRILHWRSRSKPPEGAPLA